MLLRASNSYPARVPLERSLPFCLAGAAVGCILGVVVWIVCLVRPQATRVMTALIILLFCVAAFAPVGWMVDQETGWVDWDFPLRPSWHGMARGAGFGAVVGLVLAAVQW